MFRGWAWSLVLMALAAGACSRPDATAGVGPCKDIQLSAAPAGGPDGVIVIINDAMRRDRVGAYGGPAETRAFDAFAADNVVFERAFTQAPWTKPSIATLFTSLYPSQHGVASDPQFRNPTDPNRTTPMIAADVLSGDLETLAEVMQKAGYRTAAFVSNPWMEKRFGFDQGFDVYDDSFARWGIHGDVVSAAALRWLNDLKPGTKFFVYIHYLDSHLPYGVLDRGKLASKSAQLAADTRPLSPLAKQAVQQIPRFADRVSPLAEGYRPSLSLIELSYDSGLQAFDQAFAGFMVGFAGHWAAQNTAIVITSDHGEALFDRGYGNHGNGLFDDEVAIPFVARFPGTTTSTHRSACPVGLIDVMPTLCAYLGIQCPQTMYGTSFIAGGKTTDHRQPRYIVTEGVVQRPSHRAIRNDSYKLLWETEQLADGRKKQNPYSLYDVKADPAERNDLLARERSSQTEHAFATLSAALRGAVPAYAKPSTTMVPLDPQTRERLRALGYAD